MRLKDQTEEAFAEDFGTFPDTGEVPKGKGYIELLVDNIVGLDNDYESFGEAFGKSFNEDELGTLKNMAVSAYEGAKEFVTSPIETTKDVATEISDSVSRLGAESLDGRIKRMYGVGYQDATEEQVTKAREAVIGDAITASSLVPAAKGATTVAKAAIPGKVQADVVGQMRSILDGDTEFRAESENPPVGLSAQVTGAVPSDIVIRPDNKFRGEGAITTGIAKATKPFAVRLTGQSQIEDMIESGLVRPKEGGYGTDKKATIYFGEMDNPVPESIFTKPKDDPTKNYTLVMDSSKAAGRDTPIQLDELKHIWTKRDGELVDVLPEVLEKNKSWKPVGTSAIGAGPSKPKSQINPLFKPKDTEDPNLVSFYSPLVSAIGAMDIGAKGKSGRDIMAYLNKRAPNVSKGELQFSRLNLDPDKKYSREELLENLEYSLEGTVAQIRSGKKTIFKGQQIPKNYVDKPTDYFEITLDAKALPGKVNTHFGSETLAHSRTTAHVDASGEKYFVLNELQSDALQNVGKSFSVPDPVENVGDIKAFLGLDARVGYNERVFDFFEKEALKPTLDKAALKEAYKNTFGITAEGRDVGQIHKDALRKAVDSDISEGDLTYLESKIDYALKDFAGYQAELKQAEAGYSPKDIPFESTSAYVKNLLLANIARAKQEGVNKLVIPNLDEIARLRAEDFEGGFEAAKKALRPTYENAVKKAVNTLNSEYGNKIKVGTRNLEYKDLTQKSGKRTSAAKELDITDFNFDPATQKVRFAQGGMVEDDQMNRLMQEGGMADDGMNREPVTGNEIPPGSLASEVRDDIPAQLSEGEYVVPADVLRYYGVRFFEDLRAQAKQGMMEMESDGRIGGTPVDAQGVPAEGQDEELTPEEEQMLMEALGGSGAAPAGMAYGGMIQQPMTTPYQDQATMYQRPVGMQEGGMTEVPFDRTQFSMGQTGSGIETRKYINPKTKEVRSFNFIGNTPLGLVPADFVPWTQELQDQVAEAPVDTSTTTQNDQRDGDRGRDRENQGQQGNSYRDWAKENYADMMSDPFSVGMRELNSVSDQGLLGSVGIIGLANDAKTLDKLSKANAALSRLDPQSTQARDLQAAIDATSSKLNSPLAKGLYGLDIVAQGKQINSAVDAVAGANKTTSTTTSTGRTNTGTTGRVDPGLSQAVKDRAAGQAAVDKALAVGKGIQGNRAADKALADKAAAQAAKDKDKPGSGGTPGGGFGTGGPGNVSKDKDKAVGGGQGASNRSGGAFAPGGLVTKPKKITKPKKGLAS
jgi:hypothetical protein